MTNHASKLGGSKPPNPKVPATEEEIRASNLAPKAFALSMLGVLLACLGFYETWLVAFGAVGLVGWYLGARSRRVLKHSQHPRNRRWATSAIALAVMGLLLVGTAVAAFDRLKAFGDAMNRKYARHNLMVVHSKLNDYQKLHGDLSPGGPVLAGVDWRDNSPEYPGVVQGELTIDDLIIDDDLVDPVRYRLAVEVTGKYSAIVTCFVYGEPFATLTISDIRVEIDREPELLLAED